MQEYMIILKNKKEVDYSPETLQKRLDEYRDWANKLGERYVRGQRLEDLGAHFKNSEEVVTDGPFLEAKEIIAGYIIFKANDLDEAIQVTQTLPLLAHFEAYVRPINPED